MKDYLRQILNGIDNPILARCLAREYLQARLLELLNNALAQTGWSGPHVTAENWQPLVAERVQALDWRQIVTDVEPFLERPADIALLTRENFTALLEK
jgi:hypothetical protein